MPTTDPAPAWALPFLAAYLVATSKRHYLRQLDDASFLRTARARDLFVVGTTAPGLVAAMFLLPAPPGLYALLVGSLWGIVVMLTVGRRVALERRRRALPTAWTRLQVAVSDP